MGDSPAALMREGSEDGRDGEEGEGWGTEKKLTACDDAGGPPPAAVESLGDDMMTDE